jgi:phenylpropionate dioxygenase-like ring-hydroxylating dioxygenase large terminal subunit
MENYIDIISEEHVWNTNWKILTENFMEGYHLPVAHQGTVGPYFNVLDTEFDDRGAFDGFTYQTFTKNEDALVGTAHHRNNSLTGKWRHTSVLPTIFPSHMYSLAPDHLWYLSLQPNGTDKVNIKFGAAIAPEVLADQDDPEQFLDETRKFLHHVQEEDRFVVEGIYKGVCSPLSNPGPLSWLERENHEFTQYIAKKLVN